MAGKQALISTRVDAQISEKVNDVTIDTLEVTCNDKARHLSDVQLIYVR